MQEVDIRRARRSTDKTNLLDFDRQGLRDFFTQLGEKPFRADQVMKWIYHRLEDDFAAMTDLGKALRAKLAEVAEIVGPPARVREGTPPTAPASGCSGMDGGNAIETVYIPRDRPAARCACPRRSAAR